MERVNCWVRSEIMMGFLMKINYLTNLKTLTTPLYTILSPTGAHWKTRNQNTEKEVSNRIKENNGKLESRSRKKKHGE